MAKLTSSLKVQPVGVTFSELAKALWSHGGWRRSLCVNRARRIRGSNVYDDTNGEVMKDVNVWAGEGTKVVRNKNLQISMSPDILDALKEIAKEERISVSSMVRTGIMLYLTHLEYSKEAKTLYFQDNKTGEKVRLEIPGVTSPSFYSRILKEGTGQEASQQLSMH